MRTRSVLLAVLSASLVPFLGSAQTLPWTVSLAFKPDHGIPKDQPQIILRVTNTSDSALRLPQLAFEVTSSAGETFVAFDGIEWLMGWDRHMERQFVVESGKTVELIFGASKEAHRWFCDSRVGGVGRYRVRAYLSSFGGHSSDGAPASISEALGDNPFAASNISTYTVDEPRGADAGAWNLIRSLGEEGGCGWQMRVEKRIDGEHSKSRYAAWRVELNGSPDADIKLLEQAITRDPRGFMADWHRLEIAEQYEHMYSRSLPGSRAGSLLRATTANDQYRFLLKGLLSSANPNVAFVARERLRIAPTHADVERVDHEIEEALEPQAVHRR